MPPAITIRAPIIPPAAPPPPPDEQLAEPPVSTGTDTVEVVALAPLNAVDSAEFVEANVFVFVETRAPNDESAMAAEIAD